MTGYGRRAVLAAPLAVALPAAAEDFAGAWWTAR